MIDWNVYKDWIFINFHNIISVAWEKRKVVKAIKGVFIPLKCRFVFSTKTTPIMYCVHYGKLFSIVRSDVMWKDKYNSPRLEESPFTSIALFNYFFFNWLYEIPKKVETHWTDIDDYWEQALWYLYYASYNKEKKGYDKLDINKSRETWPWRDEDDNSTWNDKFIIKNEVH